MSLSFLLSAALGPIKAAARADLLSEELARRLGEPVRVEIVERYADLHARVRAGDFELAWTPPKLCADAAARIRYRIVRRGQAQQRAVLLVRDGEIRGLAGLAGRRAVWTDRLSAGGHLLAVAWLTSQGYVPDVVFASQTYSGSYVQALQAVLDGRADLTSLYAQEGTPEEARRNVQALVGQAGSLLSVLAVTGAVSGDGLLLGEALAPARADAVAERLEAIRPHGLLFQILDGERLERAGPDAWALLRDL